MRLSQRKGSGGVSVGPLWLALACLLLLQQACEATGRREAAEDQNPVPDLTPRAAGCGFFSTGAPCDRDGNLCTIDTCVLGTCIYTKNNVKCPAWVRPAYVWNASTIDEQCRDVAYTNACNPKTGVCELGFGAIQLKADGTPCEADNNKCTADACKGGKCVSTGKVISCPQPKPTPRDPTKCIVTYQNNVCSPLDGKCHIISGANYLPAGSWCDLDKSNCTHDACGANNQCIRGFATRCPTYEPPVVPCKTYSGQYFCNKTSGACYLKETVTVAKDGTSCDTDGDLCNKEYCRAGVCKKEGEVTCPQPVFPKTDGCTAYGGVNVCNKLTGKCELKNVISTVAKDGTPCDRDGDKCTLDVCKLGKCVKNVTKVCPKLTPPPITRDNQCEAYAVSSSCDKTTGNCVAASSVALKPDGTACRWDPENLCTLDTCISGKCVQGRAKVCNLPISYRPPPYDKQCVSLTVAQECVPKTGGCIVKPIWTPQPLNTPCDADNNQCTFDRCMIKLGMPGNMTCQKYGVKDCLSGMLYSPSCIQTMPRCNADSGACSGLVLRPAGYACTGTVAGCRSVCNAKGICTCP